MAPEAGSPSTWALFVGPQEAGHFGAEQLDEGLWEHFLVFLCVLEVVLGMGQHLKEGLDELLVLQRWQGVVSSRVTGGKEEHRPPPQQPLNVQWHLTLHTPRTELWTPILTICSSFRIPQVHSSYSPLLPSPSVKHL